MDGVGILEATVKGGVPVHKPLHALKSTVPICYCYFENVFMHDAYTLGIK